mmetsp:Transcript_27883/g.39199  ORF Transcript_27883/g.39199 Transcript_27883/m.39199 type:complete len:210 (+) Transcript_27883:824-1453(+)
MLSFSHLHSCLFKARNIGKDRKVLKKLLLLNIGLPLNFGLFGLFNNISFVSSPILLNLFFVLGLDQWQFFDTDSTTQIIKTFSSLACLTLSFFAFLVGLIRMFLGECYCISSSQFIGSHIICITSHSFQILLLFAFFHFFLNFELLLLFAETLFTCNTFLLFDLASSLFFCLLTGFFLDLFLCQSFCLFLTFFNDILTFQNGSMVRFQG